MNLQDEHGLAQEPSSVVAGLGASVSSKCSPHEELLGTRLVALAMRLAVLTSSFDIFLSFQIVGYTVRFSQLATVPIVTVGALALLSGRRWPVGGVSLVLWTLVQFVFMFNSGSLSNALGYECWLAFDVLTVFGFSSLLNERLEFNRFMRFYLNSFFIMALIGLLQFALYPLGVNFFVEQSWTSSIARINGFSYEPSYYATYMLIGFVMHAYLLEKRSYRIVEKGFLQRNLVAITMAMVLSSSRMGWLMMVVWVVLRVFLLLGRTIRTRGVSMRRTPHSILLLVAISAASCIVVFCAVRPDLSMFGEGLGLFGSTTTHSSSERIAGLRSCIAVFLKHPLFGYSLGGVDPALAAYKGLVYSSSMNGQAMSIIGELLVANGVIGLLPFLWYFGKIIATCAQVGEGDGNSQEVFHRALVWALVFELGILCMNQNILRPYLWLHIAIIAASWNLCRTAGRAGHASGKRQGMTARSHSLGEAR